MQIDIAIVNYHSADQVADCLTTLGLWDGGTIWLVDNSCDAEQAQTLRALGQKILLYACSWRRTTLALHKAATWPLRTPRPSSYCY